MSSAFRFSKVMLINISQYLIMISYRFSKFKRIYSPSSPILMASISMTSGFWSGVTGSSLGIGVLAGVPTGLRLGATGGTGAGGATVAKVTGTGGGCGGGTHGV